MVLTPFEFDVNEFPGIIFSVLVAEKRILWSSEHQGFYASVFIRRISNP
jgi:hypothetical protein